MAISRHGFANAAQDTGTSITFAYDVGASTNRVLAVAVVTDANITTVTYNGDAVTERAASTSQVGPTELWSLDDPDTGSNNVVVSGAGSGFRVSAVSYNDAGTFATAASANGTSADPTVTITKSATSSYLIDCISFVTVSDTLDSPATGQSEIVISTQTAGGFKQGVSDKATGNNMGWNTTDGAGWDYVAIEITEDAAPAGPGNLKSLDTNLKANIKSYNTNLLANIKSINTNV